MAAAGNPAARGAAAALSPASASASPAASALRWLRLRPPLLALALLVLALALHAAMLGPAAPFGRLPLAGAAVAAAGFGWLAWAVWCLRAAGTPIALAATPLVLVEEGPFRYGRHPMYLGIAAMLLGAALALGVPALVPAAAAFAAVVQRVHVPFEEAQLQARFGGWYSDYRSRVRRWF